MHTPLKFRAYQVFLICQLPYVTAVALGDTLATFEYPERKS